MYKNLVELYLLDSIRDWFNIRLNGEVDCPNFESFIYLLLLTLCIILTSGCMLIAEWKQFRERLGRFSPWQSGFLVLSLEERIYATVFKKILWMDLNCFLCLHWRRHWFMTFQSSLSFIKLNRKLGTESPHRSLCMRNTDPVISVGASPSMQILAYSVSFIFHRFLPKYLSILVTKDATKFSLAL